MRLYTILGPVFFVPAAALLVTPIFVLHNYSGLETTFFGLMAFELFYQASREHARKAALVSLILIFTRPEGVLFSLAVAGYAALCCRNWRFVLYAATPLAAFAVYIGFRYVYFGLPLPNTYYMPG